MKCWECKKKISHSHRIYYFEYHIEEGLSEGKFRDICDECYPKLKFEGGGIRVNKITQRSLKGAKK